MQKLVIRKERSEQLDSSNIDKIQSFFNKYSDKIIIIHECFDKRTYPVGYIVICGDSYFHSKYNYTKDGIATYDSVMYESIESLYYNVIYNIKYDVNLIPRK